MNLIASLPWYDHPVSSAALDLFWAKLQARLVQNGLAAPVSLNRSTPLAEQWQSPRLLLSQCCGPDLFTSSAGNTYCLGRPAFADLECPAGYYYSHIVSNGNSVSNPTVAINSPTSWSGNMALAQWLDERGKDIAHCITSGSHENSLQLLRRGQVDVISIDAHTWELLDNNGIKIIGCSGLAPTPPFISGIESACTRQFIAEILRESLNCDGDFIGITGLLSATEALYAPVASIYGLDLSRRVYQEPQAEEPSEVRLF